MKHYPLGRHILLLLALLTAPAGRLAAQQVLYADYDGKFYPVLAAQGNKAYVMVKDKLVAADGHSFALNPGKVYLPVFVSVRNLQVRTSFVDAGGRAINNEFHFQAALSTSYQLDDVFIVLELFPETSEKIIFLQEVGQLAPREARAIALMVPLSSALGHGHFRLRLFSHGIEVLQSQIPAAECDEAVDRMIAARLPAGPEAAPQFFVGPEPEYPPDLLQARTRGQAVIAVRIGANGRVYDPAVKSATTPVFGEAALAAVRLWRFLPRMKAGRPVETRVDVPVIFTPPVKPETRP